MHTPSQSYRHTQLGRVIAACCIPGLVPVVVLVHYIRIPEVNWVAAAIVGFQVLVLLLFGSLTVEVAGGHLRIRFGIGLIRKRWPLDGIESCRPVRNSWIQRLGHPQDPGSLALQRLGPGRRGTEAEERQEGPHRHRRAAGAPGGRREGAGGAHPFGVGSPGLSRQRQPPAGRESSGPGSR